MSFNRAMPSVEIDKSLERIRLLEAHYSLASYHSLHEFWVRWRQLHERFIKRISQFTSDTLIHETYVEQEIKKLLRFRKAMLSSAVQYFHPKDAKESQEAKLFAIVWAESDKVWTETIEAEVARLRRVYAARQRVRRVLGAYSGH